MNVSARKDGNQGRTWVAVGEDMAAGYERDALGHMALIGLVVYSPTTAKLRDTRLRELQAMAMELSAIKAMKTLSVEQDEPPSPEQLASMWSHIGGTNPTIEATIYAIQHATTREALTRHQGEAPDDFYGRVAAAYWLLSEVTDTPTNEIAKRAGVPPGTAASWVSRAKARGMFDKVEDDRRKP